MTTCRWCGSAIVEARTLGGKRIPLDAAPSLTGTWALSPEGVAELVRPGVVNSHNDHNVTCPGAIGKRP